MRYKSHRPLRQTPAGKKRKEKSQVAGTQHSQ